MERLWRQAGATSGALALELRLEATTRATKDIDLGRTSEQFTLDIGFTTSTAWTPDSIENSDLLSFAGIERVKLFALRYRSTSLRKRCLHERVANLGWPMPAVNGSHELSEDDLELPIRVASMDYPHDATQAEIG